MDGADVIDYIVENSIDGVLVECGVEGGNMEVAWIHRLKYHREVRDIYMYDTFTGLTEPGEHDYTCDDATLYSMNKHQVYATWKNYQREHGNDWCFASLSSVQSRLSHTGYPEERLHYVVGDVMETLRGELPDRIAVLRLDTDWYESSKMELEMLYDKVVPGGVIIFDDYYHWNGQRKATDEFFSERGLSYEFVRINQKTAAILVQRAFPLAFGQKKPALSES